MSEVPSQGITKKNGDNVSPCKTPVTMSKNLELQSGEWNIAFMFLLGIIIAVTISLGTPYACSIYSIFALLMESNTLEKSTNNIVALRFFKVLLWLFDGWSESKK